MLPTEPVIFFVGGAASTGGFTCGAPAPAAMSTSSAPVTTGGLSFGLAPAEVAPATTSSGFQFGGFGFGSRRVGGLVVGSSYLGLYNVGGAKKTNK
jgi:hypothetical protein